MDKDSIEALVNKRVDRFLFDMKDTLLMQLIGFIQDDKARRERMTEEDNQAFIKEAEEEEEEEDINIQPITIEEEKLVKEHVTILSGLDHIK